MSLITDFTWNRVNALIVDASSAYARAFFANMRDGGDPVATIRSVLQTVFSLLDPGLDRIGMPISHTLFCWDGEHGRDKGNRPPKPRGYVETRQTVRELLTLILGAAHATPAKHEADDACATAVQNNWRKFDNVYVISGDKDLLQLQGGNVHYYSLGEQALLSSVYICNKYKVKQPSQIAIALAVIGDPVDNIRGVPGWGKKRAAQLFEAVTPDMNFEKALKTICNQIPAGLQNDFWTSLERTLLDPAVPDVPDPAPLKLADPCDLDGCGLPGLRESYERMYTHYA